MVERQAKSRQERPSTVPVPEAVRPLLERIGRAADAQAVPAYAVGGCVRDWLLGQDELVDLDVMVEGDGIAFANALARELAIGVMAHEQFGTATLTLNESFSPSAAELCTTRIDIASARKELYAAPASYPSVQPGQLRDDLLRRDFTINAMAMALNPARFGMLLDPFGGRDDLERRLLRIMHPKSFLDDPSRILRAARFAPRFGCRLEPTTEAALKRAIAHDLLSKLNRGRLRRELQRMTEEPDPVACLRWLSRWLAIRPGAKSRAR